MASRSSVVANTAKARKYTGAFCRELADINSIDTGKKSRDESMTVKALKRRNAANGISAAAYAAWKNSDRKKLWDTLGW